jgi:hypothetical protein
MADTTATEVNNTEWQEVQGTLDEVTAIFAPREWSTITGYYQGHRSDKGDQGYHVISNIVESDDETLGFWGSTDLNDKLRRVRSGARVRITYTGTEEVAAGYSPKQLFKVETSSGLRAARRA